MTAPVVYVNGRFVEEPDSRIPLLTHALHYGTGIFEGIRAYLDDRTGDLLLFRAVEHFERMERNARILHMKLPHRPEELVAIACELVRRNGYGADTYVRPILFKSATRVGVTLPPEESFAMMAVPMGSYLDVRGGIHCGVSSWRRIADNAIPARGKICGSYVNSTLAAQEARDRGFDEAIFLNEEGRVAEGAAMNLFLVRSGRLVTPDGTQGILEGITRDTVMVLARESLGLEVVERPVERSELYMATEVFLCGTAAQIVPVVRVDGREVGGGRPGPLTVALQSEFDQVVRGRSDRHRDWIVPVYDRRVPASPPSRSGRDG